MKEETHNPESAIVYNDRQAFGSRWKVTITPHQRTKTVMEQSRRFSGRRKHAVTKNLTQPFGTLLKDVIRSSKSSKIPIQSSIQLYTESVMPKRAEE